MKLRSLALLAPVLSWSFAACGGSSPLCSPDAINAKLKGGATVEIGACTVNGAIDIPAGATLKGQGIDKSIITGTLLVHADRGTTSLIGFKLLSQGPAGIVVRGSGSASISNVTVEATVGVAIGAEGLEKLEMSSVNMMGPVTSGNAQMIPNGVTPADNATHGLVLVNITTADLADVTSGGFATVGALFVTSDVKWDRGGASDNLALGIAVEGGRVTFNNISVCRTLQGILLLPAFGLVFTSSASVTTMGVKACENQGYGILQDGGDAVHQAIDLEDNTNAALWSQHTTSLDLSGTLKGNHFAAVVLVGALGSVIHDAEISNTVLATRVFHGTTMEYEVGDGVQLVDAADSTVLRDVAITNNDRTGVLVELGGKTATAMTFDNVTVRVSGNQHGAIAQNGPTPDGWDVGIKREGVLESVDQSFAGMLPFVKAVGPCNLPKPSDLHQTGLVSLTGM